MVTVRIAPGREELLPHSLHVTQSDRARFLALSGYWRLTGGAFPGGDHVMGSNDMWTAATALVSGQALRAESTARESKLRVLRRL